MSTRERIRERWEARRRETDSRVTVAVQSGDRPLTLPMNKQREWVGIAAQGDGLPIRPTDDAPDLTELARARRRRIRVMSYRRMIQIIR